MYVQSLRVSLVLTLAGGLCLAAVAGCAPKGPETVEVTGTVTLDGQPVEGAIVGFRPTEGTPGAGTTDASGKFTLKATPGPNGVTVIKSETVGEAPVVDENTTAVEVQTKNLLPVKYSAVEGSGLSFDVQPGMAPVTIDLKSN
ncbi:MAG: hypothetical protein ACYC6Y_13185 [Thermoguttaceae bacterium]